MITVHISECYDSCDIKVEGHAGYAGVGQDIICSAVSSLCYALGETLYRHAERGKIEGFNCDYTDGFVLSFRGENEASLGALEMFKTGIEMICEDYPENIEII